MAKPTPVLEARAIDFDRKHYPNETLVELYRGVLLPRMIEEKMLILLRQSKISKWFSGIGQEAIAAGVALALRPQDYIMTLHRNLAVFTGRDVPLVKLFAQWQGKAEGFTKGRDRSFHFGTPEHRIIGMISHLGAMLPVANGTALASNLKDADFIAAAFSGDGGASEGDFHEALNVASVWDLPVIFVVENNGYGLSTPSSEQFRCRQFAEKAPGYGMQGYTIDGNNVIEVYNAVQRLAAEMRRTRRPVILECMSFRMRGHEEASGVKYVPRELMAEWSAKDPVANYELYLKETGVLSAAEIEEIRADYKALINQRWAEADALPQLTPNTQAELADVYRPAGRQPRPPQAPGQATQKRFVDAIQDGMRQAMDEFPNLILMGQDIAEYGGVFKITEGFVEQYGRERVRNTPLCESAILGSALGLSLEGYKSMVEMQFADFVSCGFNQIVNNLAKTHYRWGQNTDVVIRMPTGGGVAAGPFHSQSSEAWFFHVPGLKIVFPATPYDAKGLLLAAFEDPNPVLFFEHKKLYRSLSGDVPDEYYALPIGEARVARAGEDATIITYGIGVHWAEEAAARYGDGAVEIIDLRSLLPWDKAAVKRSVGKTGKCLILHEATLTGGVGAEIAAFVAEECFERLDAPVMRAAALDTPVPFNAGLENQFFPLVALESKLNELLEW